MRTLGREITTDKFNITLFQKNTCLDILQEMVSAKCEEQFTSSLEKLNNVAPDSVKLYYYKNWHSIKEEWCKVFQMGKTNFFNCTNNRIESINSKLKSTISKQSSLIDFINALFSILNSLESERLHNGKDSLQKNRLIPQSDGILYAYAQVLSPRALNSLEEQIRTFEKINYPIKRNDDVYTIHTSQEGIVTITPTSCGCNFNRAMLLPCRHIFALRHAICLPIFDESLVPKRWTRSFYYDYIEKISCLSSNNQVKQMGANVTTIKKQKPKTVQEKRKMALNLTNEIVDIASLLNMDDFNNFMNVLKNLKSHLQSGTEFQIVGSHEHSGNLQNTAIELCDPSQNMQSTSSASTSQSGTHSIPAESQDFSLSNSHEHSGNLQNIATEVCDAS